MLTCEVITTPNYLRWMVGPPAEMAWSEGDQWALTVDLPAGKHEFKIAVGSKRGDQVEWEHGHNRVVEVRGDSLHKRRVMRGIVRSLR